MGVPSTLLRRMAVVLLTLGVIGAGSYVAAYPEPSLVNPSWQLDVTHQTPKLIAVKGLEGRTRWYWYMPYKVVNKTDAEQLFVPDFAIATDEGDVIRAGQNVPADVFDAVLQKLNNPLIEHPLQVSGRILIGGDQAKESFAVWPWFEHDVDEMAVFFSGLSGETQMITHPATGEPLQLRKTLMLLYRTPGTDTLPQNQSIQPAEQIWVMR